MRKNPLSCPCGTKRGLWQIPLVELAGFALGLAGMALVGWSWLALPLIIGLGLLPAIALVDIRFGVIPDGLNLLIAIAGVAATALGGEDVAFALITSASLLGLGLFLALVYSRLRGREMLGLGDVKFFAAAGLWLQPMMAPWFLALAGGAGVIFSIAWRIAGGGKESPFAPSLCLALAACVFIQLARMQ